MPSFLGLFINPFYFVRNGLHKKLKLLSHELKGDLIDFGCGAMPYKELFNVATYTGLDYAESGHECEEQEGKIYYDGKKIPFEESSVDALFASEVFEHIFNLEQILEELHRVLKPGGKLLFTIPFAWEEHEVPHDFARYSSYGIISLLEKHGFKILQAHKSGTAFETCAQLFIAYVYGLFPKMKWLNLLLTLLLIAPLNIMTLFMSLLLPKNNNLYLNNVMLVEKVTV
ncbi:class I SAM-dependent methyltransferase [Lentisphaera profundi]|uniref:Class I SAM-dependent methyltransferase n=1 Tax=Lentisphaera profundi TaxID=1658616 RepID=A0ABY7VP75_9BACT|nr:class I SAM-dependent methyltransferase [Lentisphaera profundi]WDE95960.1 class I SAM-dependent methyltransferase [Lentisphaera profundi]